MESEEKDMTVIGEFRYVNHYFKIYEEISGLQEREWEKSMQTEKSGLRMKK